MNLNLKQFIIGLTFVFCSHANTNSSLKNVLQGIKKLSIEKFLYTFHSYDTAIKWYIKLPIGEKVNGDNFSDGYVLRKC